METIQEYLLRGKNLEKDTAAFVSFLTQIKQMLQGILSLEIFLMLPQTISNKVQIHCETFYIQILICLTKKS